jgi:hypothetical protein
MCPLCFGRTGQKRSEPPWPPARAVTGLRADLRGEDHRRVAPAKREAALAHYLEGVGLRATECLVGVSHNAS